MKKPLLLLLALVFANALPAQVKKSKKNKEVEVALDQRQWIIALEDPLKTRGNKKFFKNHPGEWERYIKQYNEDLKQVVDKHWYLTEEKPIFKTREEIEKLSKEKDANQYALLFFAHRNGRKGEAVKLHLGLIAQKETTIEERDHFLYGCYIWATLLEFYNAGDIAKALRDGPYNMWQEEVPLANILPEKSDMVYGIRTLQNMVENEQKGLSRHRPTDRIVGADSILKEKTLLLLSDWIDESFDTSSIKSLYPYSYRIVDRSEFNQLIFEGSPEYAYIMILPDFVSLYYDHYIVDAATGKWIDVIREPHSIKKVKDKKSVLYGQYKTIWYKIIESGKHFNPGIGNYIQSPEN